MPAGPGTCRWPLLGLGAAHGGLAGGVGPCVPTHLEAPAPRIRPGVGRTGSDLGLPSLLCDLKLVSEPL